MCSLLGFVVPCHLVVLLVVGPLCFNKSKINTAVYQEIRSGFHLLKSFMAMPVSFLIKPTTCKQCQNYFQMVCLPCYCHVNFIVMCLIDKLTHLTWTLQTIYRALIRVRCEILSPKVQMSWRLLSKQPGF